ncbi:MAG: Calx-beta domain-containing protein [Cyanobacteria bacterium P01_H01_bin.35]
MTIIGTTESERLIGTRRSEKIFGSDGDDTLEGRRGFDHLFGGDGNDLLIGGQGRDRFNGGRGNDTLTGSASKDFFIFDAGEEIDFNDLGVDTITDFVPAQDTIILAKRIFTEISSDAGDGFSIDSEFANVTDNAATSDAIIVYDSTTGELFYNANGSQEGFGDGGQFAVLENLPDLGAEDFRLRANPTAEPEFEVSIEEVSVLEGDIETTDATFTVNLNAPSEQTIEVGYDTDPIGIAEISLFIPDEAIAGEDYEVTRGILTFNPGETTKTFTVPIIGDTQSELDDFFTVYLLDPTTMNTNSPNILATTKGIIENDDAEIANNIIRFTPSSTEEEIAAQNGPSIEIGSQTIYRSHLVSLQK